MKLLQKYIPLLVLAGLFLSFALISGDDDPEKDLQKSAEEHFENGEFLEAAKEYERLISLDPGNYDYRFHYGACLLYSEQDKTIGLKYLRESAGKEGVGPLVYYFLGRGFHLNYRFADATKAYEKFDQLADDKLKKDYQIERHLKASRSGRRLMSNLTDIEVLNKRSTSDNDFYYLYNQHIEGSLLIVDELRTKEDEKRGHKIIMHIRNPQEAREIFYSSYGKKGEEGLQIYKIKRFPDGTWAQPQLVKGAVNTPYDENFPAIDASGEYLYFCSKGHNSMGGYDVFRAKHDPETDTYGEVENLDFAVNTPDDDLLYILSADEKQAVFASARESVLGKLHVYNVSVERYPVVIAMIKGSFMNTIDPSNQAASITVTDVATGDIVGVFNSAKGDGGYFMTLPKGGKYSFKVQSDATGKEHEVQIEVPPQKELRVMPQELELIKEDGIEKLIVRNMFDQTVPDNDIIVSEVLKERASLEVNEGSFVQENTDPVGPENTDNTDTTDTEIDTTDTQVEEIGDEEIIAFVEGDAKELQDEVIETKKTMDAAYSVAQHYQEKAREDAGSAREALEMADKAEDPNERQQFLDAAKQYNQSSIQAREKAEAAFTIAEEQEERYKNQQEEADIAQQYADGIKEAIEADSREEAIEKFNEQIAFIEEVMERKQKEPQQNDRALALRQEAAELQDKARSSENYLAELRSDEEALEQRIDQLNEDLENARRRDKEGIQEEIGRTEQDLVTLRDEINKEEENYQELRAQADNLFTQANVLEGNTDGIEVKELTDEQRNELVNDINNGELAETINQNAERIEDPENSSTNGTSDTVDQQEDLTQLPDYVERSTELEEAGDIQDPRERVEKQIEVNEAWMAELNEDLEKTRHAAASEEDDERKEKLEENITALQDQIEEREREQQVLEQQRDELGEPTVVTNAGDPVNWLPDYAERKEAITNDETLDDASEKAALVDLNEELLNTVDSRRSELQEKNENGSITDEEKTELDQIDQMIAQVEAENEAFQEASDVTQVASPDEYLPAYSERRSAIENSDRSNEEKANDLIALNLEALEEISSRKDELINDTNLTDEKVEEAKMLDELEAQLLEENQQQEQDFLITAGALEWDEVSPGITEQLSEIDNSAGSEEERNQQKRELLEIFLAEVVEQKDEAQKELESDAGNTELAKRVDALGKTEEEVRKQLAAIPEASLVDNTDNTDNTEAGTPREELIAAVDPAYQDEKSAIENNTELSDAERATELRELNQDLIESTDTKLEEQLEKVQTDPTDEAAKKELEELIELRQNLQEEKVNNTVAAASEDPYNTDYTTESESMNASGADILSDEERRLEKIREFGQEEMQLRDAALGAEDEKDAARLEKKADRYEKKQAGQELKVDEEIAAANLQEYEMVHRRLEENRNAAGGIDDPTNPDLIRAQELEENARLNMEGATELRASAEDVRDKVERNNMIKTAAAMEREAIEQERKASQIYDAMSQEEYIAGSASGTVQAGPLESVAERPGERMSQTLRDQAEEEKLEANRLATQANVLQDSASTQKKEEDLRPLLAQVDSLREESMAAEKRSESLYTAALAYEEAENEFIAEKEAREAPQDMSNDEKDRIRRTEEYQDHYELMTRVQETRNELKKASDELAETRIEIGKLEMDRSDLENILAQSANENERNETQAKIDAIGQQLDELKQTEQEQSAREEEAYESYQQAREALETFLRDKDEKLVSDLYALTGRNGDFLPIPLEPLRIDPTEPDFELPEIIDQPIFARTQTTVYDDENPIPIDGPCPRGIVYKVQVGAYVNPIPYDLFKDFAPLSGQRLDNGVIRYMVGYFATYQEASEARDIIRGMPGYGGAFVVAYDDCDKILAAEARRRQEAAGVQDIALNTGDPDIDNQVERNENNDNVAVNENGNNPDNENNGTDQENNTGDPVNNETNENTDGGNENTDVATNTNVETEVDYTPDPDEQEEYVRAGGTPDALQGSGIKGLYFTVQVGAYSKPVDAESALNIRPLIYFKINNLYKYSTGKFTSVEDATAHRNEVRATTPATDAFVRAYYNGETLTVAEALALLEEQGPGILTGAQGGAGSGSGFGDLPLVEVEGLQYFVFLGKYEEAVPQDIAEIILNNSDKGINRDEDEDFNIQFTTDKVATWQEAKELEEYFKSEGIADAELRSVYGFNEIPLQEAEQKRQEQGENAPAPQPDPTPDVEETPDDRTELDAEQVLFQVILGVYEDEVPQDFARMVLENGDRNIQRETDEDFNTVFKVGSFDSYADAAMNRDYFIGQGVDDPQIKAYRGLEEIPLEQALDAEGVEPGTEDETPIDTNVDSEEEEPEPTPEINEAGGVDGLWFHVFLGKYEEETPGDVALVLVQNSDKGIESEMDEDFNTVYKCGKFATFREAEEMRDYFIDEGIEDASVFATYRYEEIDLEEAKRMINGDN